MKFEDDEDETGKNPLRRVPARFVLRRSEVEELNDESDDEDVDLDNFLSFNLRSKNRF